MQAFGRGGGSGELLTTKTQCICVHTCDVFSLFMKLGDPPKGWWWGGGGGGS